MGHRVFAIAIFVLLVGSSAGEWNSTLFSFPEEGANGGQHLAAYIQPKIVGGNVASDWPQSGYILYLYCILATRQLLFTRPLLLSRAAIPVSGEAHHLHFEQHIPVRRNDCESLICGEGRTLPHGLGVQHQRTRVPIGPQRLRNRRPSRPFAAAVDDASPNRTRKNESTDRSCLQYRMT